MSRGGQNQKLAEREDYVNLFCDSQMDDGKRRSKLYRGSVFVYPASPGVLKLCEFARELVAAAFWPHDPRTVHESMPVERSAEILETTHQRDIY